MAALGLEFHAGYGTLALIGGWDEATRTFTRERIQSIDYGIDFYAPQPLESYDGRRIMIAWMQNWTNSNCQPQNARIFGEMTIPRELSVKDGRLVQNPVRELKSYRGHRVAYCDVLVTRETNMQGVSGRILDMTVSVRPAGNSYQWFKLNVARDGEHVTTIRYKPDCSTIRYKPDCSTVRVDRTRCGIRYDVVHVRDFLVRPQGGAVKLRVVMDRHSLELFVNGGEQAATFILYTPESADAISFEANPGGAPCNVLAMLKKLDKRCAFIGKVGDDMFGTQLRVVAEDAGICMDALALDHNAHTTLAFVKTLPGGDRDFSFYRNPGADMMLTPEDIPEDMVTSARVFLNRPEIRGQHKRVRKGSV